MKKDLFDQRKPQTISKHNIFENYLDPWAKILSTRSWIKDIYYIDAFAGTGKYTRTGEAGSPVIAGNILLRYQKSGCKFHCICVEKEPKRYNILENSVKQFKGKLDVETYNGEFLSFIQTILDRVKNCPAFFFIDPEGFSGMDFDKIEAILDLPSKEILVNFQYNAIQRWLKAPKVENTITTLFGTSNYKKCKNEVELIELYKKQLRQTQAFVWYFKNKFPNKNRTLYYLIYATKDIIGFKIMKDVMFGEASRRYFEPSLFAEMDFETFQERIFKKYRGSRGIEYNKVLAFVLQETNYLAKDSDKALKNIGAAKIVNPEKKHNPFLNFPSHNSDSLRVKNSHVLNYQTALMKKPMTTSRLRINYKEYKCIDGRRKVLVERVNDGSIITRFDKTPLPKKSTDVICPHFLELKWAYGCPFDCAWCYLKGTFRFRPEGIKPVVKNLEKVKLHTDAFLNKVKIPEILNTGEIADSLMAENSKFAFSKIIVPMFEKQNRHKVLFLTKSNNIRNFLEINPHNQVIMSFSLNALPVAKKWEKKAPTVKKRIEAAKRLSDLGYEIRIRIDPMVPISNWEKHYKDLLDLMFADFIPERITFGSLCGLQSTLNVTKDNSWKIYLKETSNWGKKVEFSVRFDMYSNLISYLRNKWIYKKIALCKETKAMWAKLGMDYKKIKCNCIW
ncbi:MAG: three-Cys-motif partner protein TcmP [bacterium]